jgi:hypothetical protein
MFRKIVMCGLFVFSYKSALCQIRDFETKFYDLFIFSSNSFLVGDEDLRYHPARIICPPSYFIEMNMNYHDVYRAWTVNNDNNNAIYQYDLGLETIIPLNFFRNNCCLNLNIQRQTLSSAYNSEYKESELSGNNFETYSFNSAFLFDGTPNKVGVRMNYATGTNRVNLKINQYPEDTTNALLNKYFYDLLEPAFGNDIKFDVTGNEINYALEYSRAVNASFNFGFNFYQEIQNYDAGINYYSNVEKIEGFKNPSSLFHSNRYTLGFSCEYKTNKFILRSLVTYSVPYYRLTVNQDRSLKNNNVNLEILNLTEGSCNGKGNSVGVGISYLLQQNISANISYTYIRNTYSGNLRASTPVLGFEIIPIAHQLSLGFDDTMNNNLFSFEFNHGIYSIWNYSIGIEYLTSDNSIRYNYKILTEFGIGDTKEETNERIVVGLYKIDIKTSIAITKYFGLKLLCNQYIPVIKRSNNEGNTSGQTFLSSETNNKHTWGGSIYSFSLFYNFN